ncbi:MAG: ABC transporter permease [Anaerolineaceae bacterium]|nr:ABC transporter permease [Anaerolineaceae bacterium]
MVTVEKNAATLVISANKHLPLLARLKYALRGTVARLEDLWHYRELIRNLVTRDLKVRYRNSVLGVMWSLFNPLLMMMVFTLVFTVLTPHFDVPNFPVFVLCAILPWNFFSASVIGSIRSIVDNSSLVNKVYFPREILPISIVLANLVNFLIALIALFALILFFRIPLTIWVFLLPAVIAVQVIFTIGFGLIMATANVFYRDTQVIMEVVMMAWFFFTPIFYSLRILPHSYEIWGISFDVARWVRIVNPMASIIDNYRTILYGIGQGGAPPDFYFFMRTLVTSLIILLIGASIFYRYCRSFGEEV